MIVMATHRRLHHGGVSITITALKQVYWISSARQYIRKLLRCCVTCNKLLGTPYRAPDPPLLPKIRVTESPPFTITGVDFTGALYIKDRTEETFRRFSSRKSLPSTIISDYASTFLAAAEDLQKLFKSEGTRTL